jgi:hypothetical protein
MSSRRRPWALRKRLRALQDRKIAQHAQAPLHWAERHERERDAIQEARQQQLEASERERGTDG